MNTWIPSYLFLMEVMQDLVGIGAFSGPNKGPLDGVYLGLFIAPTPAPSPALLLSGITEADYDGYARQAIVWYPCFVDSLGPQDLASHDLFFSPIDKTVPNTITGVFISDALTDGNLLLSASITPVVFLGGPSNAMKVEALFQLPFTAIYGGPQVLS